MKIFVDENVPKITVTELREKGHDVIDIRGTLEQGIADDMIWLKAQEEKCLLITTDKGFTVHREETHYGILIIRLKHPNRLKIHHSVMRAMRKYTERDWPGLMVVMRDSVLSTWKSHNQK